MSTQKSICQSCGMKLKKDPQGGGTNEDGSKSDIYCSYCYQNGDYTFKGTVEEFQKFSRKQMIKLGHSRLIAWICTRGMKKLPRWIED